MTAAASTPTAPQLRFFAAGLEILAEDGYGALKLAALCRRVGVTTGSFYHAFPNWGAYTSALIDYWHADRTLFYAESVNAEPDPIKRVEMLIAAALELPHNAELAIRVWAGIDTAVAKVQAQVDALRLVTVNEAFTAVVPDTPEAQEAASNLAHTAFFLLVGYEQSHAMGGAQALEWALRLVQQQVLAYASS